MKKSDAQSAGARQRKQTLLPQIYKLDKEGRSCREIGQKLGLSKTTVVRWLRAMQGKPPPMRSRDPARLIRKKIARYRSIYHEAINAWRRSQSDKQVRLVEDSGPADDPSAAKKKRSIRSETRTGHDHYLTSAMRAEKAIDELEQRLAALQGGESAAPGDGLSILAELTDDDLEKLTSEELESFSDEQLLAIEMRLRAKYGMTDQPLTAEDLENMTGDDLAALEAQLLQEIKLAREAETQ